MDKLVSAAGTGLTTALGWVGEVLTALTAEAGQLAPLLGLLGIGIGVTAMMLGIRVVRGFTWGG